MYYKLLLIFCWLTTYLRLAAQPESGNLPLVVIQTNGTTIINEPKVTVRMGIIDNGSDKINRPEDSFNVYDGWAGIEIRGASTQGYDQKSYSFETRDEAGKDLEVSLLGLPEESDWVLRAPYADKSLIRDALTYQISNDMGRWAPHTRFCEVFIDGEYKGVYVLLESVKRSKNRLNLSKLDDDDLKGSQLTGGYIFKVDRWYESEGWEARVPPSYQGGSSTVYMHYVYPKGDAIQPEQTTYIQAYVDSFQAVCFGNAALDTTIGWRRFADENSFIDHFLINELSRNVDAYRLSGFYHKDRNGKLNAGPAWDYNFSFRNADYCDGQFAAGWTFDLCGGGVPFWWFEMLKDPLFRDRLRCRWEALRPTVLSNDRILHVIDSLDGLVSEAKFRHYRKYQILGQYVWPNPNPLARTQAEEVAALKKWVVLRLAWMDDQIPGTCRETRSELPKEERTWFVSPNPASSVLSIYTFRRPTDGTLIELFDMGGRLVWQAETLNDLTEIPVKNFANGMYHLQITDLKGVILHTQKVLKID